MKYLDILRNRLAELNEQRAAAFAEMEAITEVAATENRSALTDDETTAFDEARTKVTGLDDDIAKTNERIDELTKIAERAVTAAEVSQTVRRDDPFAALENRDASPTELRDAVIRTAETRGVDPRGLEHLTGLLRKHADDTDWARNILARSHPTYERAFAKYLASPSTPMWDPDEQRAIAVGTNTSGGFLVPTIVDATLILTNSGTDNVIRDLARVITLTGNANSVYPISTAGVTASWDPEFTEVSDDSPAVARDQIPIYKGAAFITASIEATQDLNQLGVLFADAKDRLEGAAFATGSGTNQPTGIFTALDANTNVELTTTTAATVGEVDLHAVYRSLGGRWRRRAVWLANPLFTLAIKRLGTAVSSAYTGDLRDAPADRILGRPFYEAEDAPSAQTTTALDNVLVFGDFSNYVIAEKPGSMAVEYIPHIFGNTNSRPIGARGWYAYWRTGADSVNDLAFRLLQDKTSA